MRTWRLRSACAAASASSCAMASSRARRMRMRLLLVLQLALLVLAGDDDAGRQVGDADRGVGGVDALAAGAGGAVDVDAQVVGVDLDLDLLGLGVDEHAGGAGVDAALRLGDGHPLHAVHAALVLQPGPHALVALGLHGDRDVLVAAEVGVLGVDDLGLPADALGVAQVHPQQVAGEQRGLLAALARLDLQDDVLVVVGVARDQQVLEPLLQPRDALLELGRLLGERRVLGGQLLGGGQVVAGRLAARGRCRRSGCSSA